MSRSRPRRGFAMIIAIALMALVGAAIVVLTRHVGYEITRTRLAATDVQLRELLIAGGRDAVARSRDWGAQAGQSEWQIDLPRPLKEAGATLKLQRNPLSPNAMEIHVDARIGDRAASQRLHFSKTTGGWTLTDAELGR